MKIISIISVLLAFVLTSACTKKQKSAYDLDTKETLRISIASEPPSLDWNKSTDTTSALIQDNMMEGLLEYDFKSAELGLKASLATEWSSSENAQKWLFKIRQGVKWSDGKEFTGQHVIDGWERLLNKNTNSEYAYFLFSLKNAKAYHEGKIKDFNQVGVKLNSEGHLVVELEGPQSYFPFLLTHHSTYPIRVDVTKKFGDNWTDPKNIVTLGPYKLVKWEHDKAIILERSENYYGTPAIIKNIVIRMVSAQSTALNLFDSGKLDALNNLPSRELKKLRTRAEYKQSGILGIYYYGFNVKKAPFDNPLVRKAFSYAIDRKEITTMLDGGQEPISSWVPPGMFGYEPNRGVKFEPSKAKQLLDEAGFKDRSKFPTVTIGFNTNEDHQRVAENVQAQLKRNLGVKVELKNEEWKVYLGSLKADAPHIFRMGWIADYPDPDNFLNLMTSYSDNNHTNWGHEKFDQIIKEAVSVTTKEARKALYSAAQKILTEDQVPVAPIYAYVSQLMVSKRVVNYPINVMSRFKFKEVSLK